MLATKIRSALLCSLLLTLAPAMQARAQGSSTGPRLFPETGKTVGGAFLAYWNAHGGVAQQGYPISGEMQEVSDTDGKSYTVQYFERAAFELHPALQPPNNVLLSLLGAFLYRQKYPAGAGGQTPNTAAGSVLFPQTGKRVGGRFLDYWQQHGGLAQQGYPISDEFSERSDLDGNLYRVQYFERAVFEMHPEKARPYDVLLSQLGLFRYRARYGSQSTVSAPTPTGSGDCTSPIAQGTWAGPLTWGFTMSSPSINGKGGTSGPVRLQVACDGSFTGTVQINDYNAKVTGNNITVLACSMSKPPIADVRGRVESGPDGKRLNITSGTFRQGVTLCTNPLSPARPTDLTGSPVTPTIVKIETESADKIGGTQWVPDASYIKLIEQFRSVYSDVQVVYSGQWELVREPINTP